MIAGDFFGADFFAGFQEDTGTPPGLVFSTMRHNRANGSIGVSNTRTGGIISTTAAVSQLDTGDSRAVSLTRRNRATVSLQS